MIKTKICFISTYSYPLFKEGSKIKHGGSEVQIFYISKYLAQKSNYEISIIVGDFHQRKIEHSFNVKLIRCFCPSKSDFILKKLYQAIVYFFILLREKPNILFTSTANTTVGLAALYCKLFKVKHIHRIAHINDVNNRYIETHGFLGKIYKYGLIHSDSIIAQSKDQQKLLLQNYNKKSVLFKNVFPISLQKGINREYILWVGRYARVKNPELFLELAGKFQNEKFVMICPKNVDLINKWEELKIRAEKMRNLEFIEIIEFHKIQTFFNSAKVFINTSESEGFPNTFIQAGIGKTPVLSLYVNPDNFITENNCGYFCEGRLSMLEENLKKLLSNDDDYISKSENINRYVMKFHSLEIGMKKIIEIIDIG